MTTRGITKKDCPELANIIDETIQFAIKIQEPSQKLIDFKKIVDGYLQEENNELFSLQERVRRFTQNLPIDF